MLYNFGPQFQLDDFSMEFSTTTVASELYSSNHHTFVIHFSHEFFLETWHGCVHFLNKPWVEKAVCTW